MRVTMREYPIGWVRARSGFLVTPRSATARHEGSVKVTELRWLRRSSWVERRIRLRHGGTVWEPEYWCRSMGEAMNLADKMNQP